MDPLFVGVGELVCNAFSVGSSCYNPDFNRGLGLMLLSVTGILVLGRRMLRSS